ncbi:MAG: response regulator [Halobacteriales archaeon]
MVTQDETATVLVVEDDRASRELYQTWLRSAFEVHTATGGEEALTTIDQQTNIDVVLLDRRLPGLSGREVLKEIRERGIECQVAMLTGVDPGLDIVHMPFDDYLRKPVSKATLVDLVNQLLVRAKYDRISQRYFALTRKLVMLETSFDEEELAESEEYTELKSEYETVKAEVTEAFETAVESVGYETLFSDLPETPPSESSHSEIGSDNNSY